MILYISSGTSYKIYNRHFLSKQIVTGQQAQRINNLFFTGIAGNREITVISILPFHQEANIRTKRIEYTEDNIKYICIANTPGKLSHKLLNVIRVSNEIRHLSSGKDIEGIVCDAANMTASLTTVLFGKAMKIKRIGIITDLPNYLSKNLSIIYRKLMALLAKQYDGYVFITEAMSEIINTNSKPYTVVEGACEPIALSAVKRPNDGDRIILFGGSLSLSGGLIEFAEAFSSAQPSGTQLHFYGDGAARKQIERMCESNPYIHYLGSLENEKMLLKFREATLLINPRLSKEEYCKYSFPIKLLDYLSSGTPVLTTRLPGIPKEYFDYMYTIDDETQQGFIHAIQSVLAKSDEDFVIMGLKAQQFVANEKNKNIQAQKIIKLLNEISPRAAEQ